MSYYVNVFLKTELTPISSFLKNCIGGYYNNAVCNGVTWLLLIWVVLHLVFDTTLDALLRKLRYQEYVRIRLKQCLWYLGFYMSAFVYCEATLIQNNLPIFTLRRSTEHGDAADAHLLLGIILMTSYFLHAAIWEGLKYSRPMTTLAYFLVSLLLSTSYFLRVIEASYNLIAIISITYLPLEIARCVSELSQQKQFVRKLLKEGFFILYNFCFLINYLFIIPFTIILPYGRGTITRFSMSILFFIFILISWLVIEIYTSVLCKAVYHWLYHAKVNNLFPCGSLIECAMFPPRTDATYNLLLLRREIQEREDKSISLRRPKNRSMVVQTLKCMVALKRKLKEQRQASSDENKNITIEDVTDKLIDDDSEIVEGEVTFESSGEVEGKLQFNIQPDSNDKDTAVE